MRRGSGRVRIDILTIFPEYLMPLQLSLIGRAAATGAVEINIHDLRRWTHDVHRTVDDTPYGGGPGMVMRPEPWGEALDEIVPEPTNARVVVPTPAGVLFNQSVARDLAREEHLIFACGRYEGIDERVLDHARTRIEVSEISIGDYVLFGGEVAALVILEAVIRLRPGVLGNADSLIEESHADGLLEAPLYTKPAVWRGLAVPEILRSGDHARIARWRREQAQRRTAERRPDLLAGHLIVLRGRHRYGTVVGSPRRLSVDDPAGCRHIVSKPTACGSAARLEPRGSSDEHAGRPGRAVPADRHPGLSSW